MLPWVLGASFLYPAGLVYDALAIPGYQALASDHSAHAKMTFLANILGDVAGSASIVILLAVLRQAADRDHRVRPGGIPAALLAPAVSMFLDFGQSVTSGWGYSGAEVAFNVLAVLLMPATAVLAISYIGRGRQA